MEQCHSHMLNNILLNTYFHFGQIKFMSFISIRDLKFSSSWIELSASIFSFLIVVITKGIVISKSFPLLSSLLTLIINETTKNKYNKPVGSKESLHLEAFRKK